MKISSTVIQVLKSFKALSIQDNLSGAQKARVEESDGRFRLWSGSLGAHRNGGHRSLEYKLRDSEATRNHVLSLFQELHKFLCQAKEGDTSAGDSESEDSEDSLSPELLKALEKLSARNKKIPFDSAPQLDLLLDQIEDVIDCLMRLSVAMQNPQPVDHFQLRTGGQVNEEDAKRDTIRIEDNFPRLRGPDVPNADHQSPSAVRPAISLGYANAERAAYFRYRKMHAALLEEGLTSAIDEAETLCEMTPGSERLTTVASSLPIQLQDGQQNLPVLQNTEDQDDDTLSQSTQTSYTTSCGDGEKRRVPDLPLDVYDEPLKPTKCVYCHRFILVGSCNQWRRHVYEDLRPYNCVIEGCQAPRRLYQRRRDWRKHLEQVHWVKWVCPQGCLESFASSEPLRSHYLGKHSTGPAAERVDLLHQIENWSGVDHSKVPDQCLFCGEYIASAKLWVSHVGKHLEQIALTALPPTNLDRGQVEEVEDTSDSSSLSTEAAKHPEERTASEKDDSEKQASAANTPIDDLGAPTDTKIQHAPVSASETQCFECSLTFPTNRELSQHAKAQKHKVVSCICGTRFSSKRDLDRHVFQKLVPKPFYCPFCPPDRETSFTRRDYFFRHLKGFHPHNHSISEALKDLSISEDSTLYVCPHPECPDHRTESWLASYSTSSGNGEKPFQSKSEFNVHMWSLHKEDVSNSKAYISELGEIGSTGDYPQFYEQIKLPEPGSESASGVGSIGPSYTDSPQDPGQDTGHYGSRRVFLVGYGLYYPAEFWPGRIVKTLRPTKGLSGAVYQLAIVLEECTGYSPILAIQTYDGTEGAMRGRNREYSGLVYDFKSPPGSLMDDVEWAFRPVRAKCYADDGQTTIFTGAELINYSELQYLEHNTLVQFVGEIIAEDMPIIQNEFERLMRSKATQR